MCDIWWAKYDEYTVELPISVNILIDKKYGGEKLYPVCQATCVIKILDINKDVPVMS